MKRRSFVTMLTAALGNAQVPPPHRSPTAAVAASPQTAFVIAGVVVNAGTNAPLGKALVQIASTTNRSETSEVVTGSDGRFSFANLPVHKFALTVTRQSGPPQAYLANDGFSSAIVTGPDQDTSNIVFPFHMPGALSGAVLDDSNEPVRNAQVHLFSHRVDGAGLRRIMPTGMTGTQSSGRFHFGHLAPGSYLVGVSGQPWFAQRMLTRNLNGKQSVNSPAHQPDPQFDVVYPFTYYPNALDPASASPIAITEDSEASMQITLRAVPSIHVRLVGGEGRADSGTNVQASILGPEGLPIPVGGGGFAPNGQGELTGLAPGRYQLSIHSFRAPTARGQAADVGEGMTMRSNFASKIVDLVDGSMVDLSAASRLAVRAVVTIAGNDRPQNRISLTLRDARTGTGGVSATAGADGTVRFPEANLSPGRYVLSLPSTPAFRVLSIEAKGAKLVSGELILEDNADVQLSVVIGRRSSVRMEGVAMTDRGPAIAAMVLLLPRKPGVGTTIYRDQSDSDGSFAFQNVSAGSYLAIAIDDGRDLAFGDTAVIRQYLPGARAVDVNELLSLPPLKLSVQRRIG